MLQRHKNDKTNMVKQSSLLLEGSFLLQSILIKLEVGEMKIGVSDGGFINVKSPSFIFLAKHQVVDITLCAVDDILVYDCIEIESSIIKKIYHDFLLNDQELLISNKNSANKCLVTPIGVGMSQIFDLLHSNTEISLFPQDKEEYLIRFLLADFIKDKSSFNLFKTVSSNTLSEDVHCLLSNNTNQKWTLEKISKMLCMSPSTLKRKLSQENTSFSKILLNARMNKARELLRKNELSITKISYMCGYDSISYFSFTFKQHFKTTPTEFMDFIMKHKIN